MGSTTGTVIETPFGPAVEEVSLPRAPLVFVVAQALDAVAAGRTRLEQLPQPGSSLVPPVQGDSVLFEAAHQYYSWI